MQTKLTETEAPTAICTDLGAIFVSLELSRSTWLITSPSPAGGSKMSKHAVRGGDIAGLPGTFAPTSEKTRARKIDPAYVEVSTTDTRYEKQVPIGAIGTC